MLINLGASISKLTLKIIFFSYYFSITYITITSSKLLLININIIYLYIQII